MENIIDILSKCTDRCALLQSHPFQNEQLDASQTIWVELHDSFSWAISVFAELSNGLWFLTTVSYKATIDRCFVYHHKRRYGGNFNPIQGLSLASVSPLDHGHCQ